MLKYLLFTIFIFFIIFVKEEEGVGLVVFLLLLHPGSWAILISLLIFSFYISSSNDKEIKKKFIKEDGDSAIRICIENNDIMEEVKKKKDRGFLTYVFIIMSILIIGYISIYMMGLLLTILFNEKYIASLILFTISFLVMVLLSKVIKKYS